MTDTIISYNGATVALKRATVRSELYSGIIYRKMNVSENMPDDEFLVLMRYVIFLTRTRIEGELGFKIPIYTDTAEALQAGFEAFLDQPQAFFDAIVRPISHMDDDLEEDALTPTPKKS